MSTHNVNQATDAKPMIMIVEDDHALQILLIDLLESEGYHALVTGSGAQALQVLAETKPNLVLLDLGLPDVTGYQLCQQIRSTVAAKLPILMVSAHRDSTDVLQALQAGANDYVRKPFAPDELLCQIRAHLPIKLHVDLPLA